MYSIFFYIAEGNVSGKNNKIMKNLEFCGKWGQFERLIEKEKSKIVFRL